MNDVIDATPRQLARIAGVLYLINILLGAFAIGIVPAVVYSSDAATALHNLQTHESLYRLGLAAHVVVTLTNIPLALIFYELFKIVSRRIALLDVFFILVATAIEAAGILHQFEPLALLGNGSHRGVPVAQVVAYISGGDLAGIDYSIHTVFFGFDILCTAYLVYRSTFLPRFISVLLAIDGLAYLFYSFADFLAPGFASDLVPLIQLPALLGEGSLCVWLLIVGVDSERWKAQASESVRMRSREAETLV